MERTSKFPLLSGYLSLDLVNTEIVRNGKRIDLLASKENLIEWIYTLDKEGIISIQQLSKNIEEWATNALPMVKQIRSSLRKAFEGFADDKEPKKAWLTNLEKIIDNAPFTYRLKENKLIAKPTGQPKDAFLALIAYDALRLLSENKITSMQRCANPDCVLLFMDTRGRRKWCSMKW